MDHHVVTWAISVVVVLLLLRMVEGYVAKPTELRGPPSNVQDTITGDKKYVYM
jgi:hypothetical protein